MDGDIWHLRLGHVSMDGVNQLIKKGVIESDSKMTSRECEGWERVRNWFILVESTALHQCLSMPTAIYGGLLKLYQWEEVDTSCQLWMITLEEFGYTS